SWRRARSSRGDSDARALEQIADDGLRVEELGCDLAGRARVTLVVMLDLLDPREHAGLVLEREHALAGRNRRREARVANERRAAAGEMAMRAVADPAAPRLDVHRLREPELRPGALDERPVGVGIDRLGHRVPDVPAVSGEQVRRRLTRNRQAQ